MPRLPIIMPNKTLSIIHSCIEDSKTLIVVGNQSKIFNLPYLSILLIKYCIEIKLYPNNNCQ